MPKQICVDVNLALKVVLTETDSDVAQSHWRKWAEEETELVAPSLFVYEGASAIRLKVTRKQVSEEIAETAFSDFQALLRNIRFSIPSDLNLRAWKLAKQLKQSQVYDAYYLALAENLGCEFWTADDKLYFSAHRTFPL